MADENSDKTYFETTISGLFESEEMEMIEDDTKVMRKSAEQIVSKLQEQNNLRKLALQRLTSQPIKVSTKNNSIGLVRKANQHFNAYIHRFDA